MTNYEEEIKALHKMYNFLRKNTNKMNKISFSKFIDDIVENDIFSIGILMNQNIINLMNSKNKTGKCKNSKIKKKRNRIMNKVFHHKQKIKHVIGSEEKEGYYDKEKNKIIFNGNEIESLNKFTRLHYEEKRPYRETFNNNAWLECKCFKNGEWISTYDLPELTLT